MTPSALKAELTTDPAGLGYAPLRSAGDDVGVAAILNRKDRPGFVPAREFAAVLARRNLWGLVMRAARFRELPDGSACPFPLYTLFVTSELAAFATFSPPLRLEVGPLTVGLDACVGAGLLTADDRSALLAEEVKISRAEVLWGYGSAVTAQQVREARRLS